ncbi:PREDICTED: DPH3 homolog [Elephantulus edwardii]|uniref:DPH3 homolog n=1 Tax=Elephantulus edwardii TaxID=28737 RepID=UPI0003F0865A|nr:PREDICTED: DPH3 homolog [Elephantulus edwardii]
MVVFHDKVEIEDFQFNENSKSYFYPYLCDDNFCIAKENLENEEDMVTCSALTMVYKVIVNDCEKDQFMYGETVPAPSNNTELAKYSQRPTKSKSWTPGNESRWTGQLQLLPGDRVLWLTASLWWTPT